MFVVVPLRPHEPFVMREIAAGHVLGRRRRRAAALWHIPAQMTLRKRVRVVLERELAGELRVKRAPEQRSETFVVRSVRDERGRQTAVRHAVKVEDSPTIDLRTQRTRVVGVP